MSESENESGSGVIQTARVEASSDGVLAIVITLLVLGLRAPTTQLFTRIASVDTGLLWRNLALLLPTSVLPFPTAVLGYAFQSGSRTDQRVGLIFYAAVAAAMAASWLAVTEGWSHRNRLRSAAPGL